MRAILIFTEENNFPIVRKRKSETLMYGVPDSRTSNALGRLFLNKKPRFDRQMRVQFAIDRLLKSRVLTFTFAI